MKKLLLASLACTLMLAVVPFAAATSPSAELPVTPEVTQADTVSPVVDEEASAQQAILAEDVATLESLFTEVSFGACIDSGIACGSARDCISVCSPLVCECQGTCVFCP